MRTEYLTALIQYHLHSNQVKVKTEGEEVNYRIHVMRHLPHYTAEHLLVNHTIVIAMN